MLLGFAERIEGDAMFISRLRLLGVKPLRCDLPPEGAEFPIPARRRLLVRGGNGSGKTVVLETIATLWRFLGEWIDAGNDRTPPAGAREQ